MMLKSVLMPSPCTSLAASCFTALNLPGWRSNIVSDTSITIATRVAMSETPKKLTADPPLPPPPDPAPDPAPAPASAAIWSETMSLGSMSTAVSMGRVGRSGREKSVGRAVDILSVKEGFGRAASNSAMFMRCSRSSAAMRICFFTSNVVGVARIKRATIQIPARIPPMTCTAMLTTITEMMMRRRRNRASAWGSSVAWLISPTFPPLPSGRRK